MCLSFTYDKLFSIVCNLELHNIVGQLRNYQREVTGRQRMSAPRPQAQAPQLPAPQLPAPQLPAPQPQATLEAPTTPKSDVKASAKVYYFEYRNIVFIKYCFLRIENAK